MISAGSIKKNSFTDDQPLTRKLDAYWEILSEHKSVTTELSKIAEKLSKDLQEVKEDFCSLVATFSFFSSKLQSAHIRTGKKTANSEESLVTFVEQAIIQQKMIVELTSTLHDKMVNWTGRLKQFVYDDYGLSKEKKKKFDKAKSSYDVSIGKANNLKAKKRKS